jgi:ABC-type cobalamin/Fe3+-siderophores transport system ATPase subunit
VDERAHAAKRTQVIDRADRAVAIENVSVTFGGVRALSDASLDVARGEFVGLVGPNGAGKTTLLRSINGLVEPDAGRVWLAAERDSPESGLEPEPDGGRLLNDPPAGDRSNDIGAEQNASGGTDETIGTEPDADGPGDERGTKAAADLDPVSALSARETSRRVATVPQNTALSFAFPVREVVAMGRTPHRSRFERESAADRTAVERAMARTEVSQFADRSIEAVSGGERQRVVLARALAQDASVLALDEPTASLDVNHQVRTLSLIAELVADGRAAIAAIHDLDLAARYCDRLCLLAEGRVLDTGPPEAVLTEATLERAFDTRAAVVRHPATGAVDVTAFPD